MEMKVVIYSKKMCPYCERAKEFFRRRGIAFEEIDLTDKFFELDKLKAKTGHMTVPQIFVGEQFIGGYTDLVSAVESGKLRF